LTTIRILACQFDIPRTYAAGHVCTETEAQTLHRALVKGISKGLFKVLTNAKAELGRAHGDTLSADDVAELQRRGEEYIAEYALGFSHGHDRLRAIRIECDRIARQLAEAKYNASGKRLDASTPEVRTLLAELAASERVRTEAERRVNVTQEIAQRAHGELLSGEDAE
jgi:hypothetical protein